MTVTELKTFPENLEFITRFDYIPGNEDLYSRKSKLFLLQDVQTKKKYIAKRVIGNQYHENEWKMPSRIDDPRIIQFTHIIHDAEYHYMVSEYGEFQDLFSTHADQSGKLDEGDLLNILKKMAECIKLCHDHKILHLDIKMENFLVSQKDPLEIILIDFGFARDSSDTQMENPNGTDLYVSPEVMSDLTCSEKSDIFSLGMVMLHLTTTTDHMTSKKRIYRFKKSKKFSEKYKDLITSMIKGQPSERPIIDQVLEGVSETLCNT